MVVYTLSSLKLLLNKHGLPEDVSFTIPLISGCFSLCQEIEDFADLLQQEFQTELIGPRIAAEGIPETVGDADWRMLAKDIILGRYEALHPFLDCDCQK